MALETTLLRKANLRRKNPLTAKVLIKKKINQLQPLPRRKNQNQLL
jgi:hypothetical protein